MASVTAWNVSVTKYAPMNTTKKTCISFTLQPHLFLECHRSNPMIPTIYPFPPQCNHQTKDKSLKAKDTLSREVTRATAIGTTLAALIADNHRTENLGQAAYIVIIRARPRKVTSTAKAIASMKVVRALATVAKITIARSATVPVAPASRAVMKTAVPVALREIRVISWMMQVAKLALFLPLSPPTIKAPTWI